MCTALCFKTEPASVPSTESMVFVRFEREKKDRGSDFHPVLMESILSYTNTDCVLKCYSFTIHFNIVATSTPTTSSNSLSSGGFFCGKYSVLCFEFSSIFYMPHTSIPFHFINLIIGVKNAIYGTPLSIYLSDSCLSSFHHSQVFISL